MERTDLVAILKCTLVFKGSEVIVIGVRPMPLLKCLRYLNKAVPGMPGDCITRKGDKYPQKCNCPTNDKENNKVENQFFKIENVR